MVQSYLVGRRNGHTTVWTSDRVALLTRLWCEGYTATQIAARIRDVKITRAAVKSKAWKMGLPARKPGRPKRVRGKS